VGVGSGWPYVCVLPKVLPKVIGWVHSLKEGPMNSLVLDIGNDPTFGFGMFLVY